MRDLRIKGLLQGVALGDTFGMPTEMMSFEEIKEKIGGVTQPLPSFPDSIILQDQPAFTVTDDTYNAIMIYEILNECKGVFDLSTYINKLVEYSSTNSNADKVIGPSTRKALNDINNGKPITETGKFGTTNGAAMKIAPVGVFYSYKELDKLVDTVASICLPTHNTTIAITGASIIAALASYLLDGKTNEDEIKDLIKETITLSKNYGFNLPSASIQYRINHAIEIAKKEKDEEAFLRRLSIEIGTGLETIETVPTALSIFFYSKGDPLLAAQLSASIGGDTDTIGAISTSLSGAMNPKLIPKEYVEQINKINKLNL